MDPVLSYQDAFDDINDWFNAVEKDCDSFDLKDHKEEVLLDCLPVTVFEIENISEKVKDRFIINRLQHYGKQYSKKYRYWFVFSRKAGHIILMLYPYQN